MCPRRLIYRPRHLLTSAIIILFMQFSSSTHHMTVPSSQSGHSYFGSNACHSQSLSDDLSFLFYPSVRLSIHHSIIISVLSSSPFSLGVPVTVQAFAPCISTSLIVVL